MNLGKYIRYKVKNMLLRGMTHTEISLQTGLTIEQIKKVNGEKVSTASPIAKKGSGRI